LKIKEVDTPTGAPHMLCLAQSMGIPMAYDNDYTTYHLTPRGWVVSDDPPPDRVETQQLHIYQASGWSKEHRNWSKIWESPDVPEAERQRLKEQFGYRP